MKTNQPPFAILSRGSEEFLLFAGATVRIGRTSDNDIIIDDPKVSRSHVVLEWNGSGFVLRDLNSSNGTFVNGERIDRTSRLLNDGDLVFLGKQISMVYEVIPPEPVVSPEEVTMVGVTEPFSVQAPYLEICAGADMGQKYPLWGEAVTIGRTSREATWEIRLTDRAVSRPHARLEKRSDRWLVVDLNSANGTFLNGKLLVPGQEHAAALIDDDMITIGETTLAFRDH